MDLTPMKSSHNGATMTNAIVLFLVLLSVSWAPASSQQVSKPEAVLRDRADVYFAGHDHDMQHLRPEGRLHFFVAGSAGKLRTIEPGPRSLFANGARGFATIAADPDTLSVKFLEEDLTSPYTFALKRSNPADSPRNLVPRR